MVVDPFTAIGLAVNVLQFIELGHTLLSKSHELYHAVDGDLVEHKEAIYTLTRLNELADNLQGSIDKLARSRRPSREELALREIAQKCRTNAQELVATLRSFTATGDNRKWKSFREAFKAMWGKEKVDEMLKQLNQHHQLLITYLLVVMRQEDLKLAQTLNLTNFFVTGTRKPPTLLNCLEGSMASRPSS